LIGSSAFLRAKSHPHLTTKNSSNNNKIRRPIKTMLEAMMLANGTTSHRPPIPFAIQTRKSPVAKRTWK
jgi:hypothetical protein